METDELESGRSRTTITAQLFFQRENTIDKWLAKLTKMMR